MPSLTCINPSGCDRFGVVGPEHQAETPPKHGDFGDFPLPQYDLHYPWWDSLEYLNQGPDDNIGSSRDWLEPKLATTNCIVVSMKLVLMVLHKATIDKSRDSHIDFKVGKSSITFERLFSSLCAMNPFEYPAFFVDCHGTATCRPLINIRPSVGDLTSYVCLEVSARPKWRNWLNPLCSFSHMGVLVWGLLTTTAEPLMKWSLSSDHTSNHCSRMQNISFLCKLSNDQQMHAEPLYITAVPCTVLLSW